MRAVPPESPDIVATRPVGGQAALRPAPQRARMLADPLRRLYREPIARRLAQALASTRVMPDVLVVSSVLAAAVAALLVSFNGPAYLVGAGVALEARAILGEASAALIRARAPRAGASEGAAGSEALRASRAAAELLGLVVLYGGLFCHVHLHPPPEGPWSAYLSPTGVLALALLQAIARGAAAAHYQVKYASIFKHARDEVAEGLLSRFITGLWAVSNLEAFFSLVVLSLFVGQLWLGQVLFATVGVAWIAGVVLLNRWFVRGAARRAKLVVA